MRNGWSSAGCVFLVAAATSIGCSSARVVDHWDELELGMTKPEVTKLVGKPSSVAGPAETRAQVDSPLEAIIGGLIVSSILGWDISYERWEYGDFELFENILVPADTAFVVYFDRDGRVVKLRRPLSGAYAHNAGT